MGVINLGLQYAVVTKHSWYNTHTKEQKGPYVHHPHDKGYKFLQIPVEKALAFRHGMNRLRTRAVNRQLNCPTYLPIFCCGLNIEKQPQRYLSSTTILCFVHGTEEKYWFSM